MINQRLNYLLEKYRAGTLNQTEYKELVWMLGDHEIERDLDERLTYYWEKEPVTSEAETTELRYLQPKRRRLLRIAGVAATLLMLLGLSFYLWGDKDSLGHKELVYKTGYGERLDVKLDDGSLITLNANSVLRWSEGWKKLKERKVTLEGEAFFKVKKQQGTPFTVYTNDVAIEVLGTSFNVDSREESTKVYLDEGQVNLKLNEKVSERTGIDHKPEIIMQPGEQVSYSARNQEVTKLEGQTMITAAAWKMNVLNFKNKQFSEVLNLLREIYGQSFECNDKKLLKTPMYLGVPYSNWEAVRQALELSLNIQFQQTSKGHYIVKTLKD